MESFFYAIFQLQKHSCKKENFLKITKYPYLEI